MISKSAVLVVLVCAVMASRDLNFLTPLVDRLQGFNSNANIFAGFPPLVAPPVEPNPDRFDNVTFDLDQSGNLNDNDAYCDTVGCEANSGIIVDFEDYLNGFTGSVLVQNLAEDNNAVCYGDGCFANSGVTLFNVQADDGRVSFQNAALGNTAQCNGTNCVANSGLLRLGEGVDATLFG
eukprot:TRINITY_DN2623_c2_g1_i1.p3 TRINITY_DN2623_c2_g1~~TRINITY_DN2623_c2_g1_i1.p3  ORF type:complete len:179 (-),score=48.50 TRINITY_DN2623_c2_g1_i1:400-936(-)